MKRVGRGTQRDPSRGRASKCLRASTLRAQFILGEDRPRDGSRWVPLRAPAVA